MFKKSKAYISLALLFVLLTTSFARVSHAQVTGEGNASAGLSTGSGGGLTCDPAKFSILKTLNSFPTSIVSTALVHSLGALINIQPWFMAFGASPAETMGCANYIARYNQALAGSCMAQSILASSCPDTPNDICEAITGQFEIGGGYRASEGIGSRYDSAKFANSKVAGSLLGYAYLVQNTTTYEPVPVNTAYFFKDYAAKLPIIGDEVYAQNTTTYGHTLIDSVLSIWKVFRNIAYAMMSLIMLWVGFAIITRKKISSQTVVNVQYALPKIVIALVMIAFSYPIGALITSLAWTLWNNSRTIIMSIGSDTRFAQMADGLQDLGIGGLVILIQKTQLSLAGAGAMLAIVSVMAIFLIMFAIFASLKALWIYVKMVIYIAVAPIQIALYALPGQDDKLEKWFKQMLSWGIGLFGMAMVNWLTLTFALGLIMDSFACSSGPNLTLARPIVSGTLFNIFIVPLLLVFGFSSAVKVPDMVEEMLMDKKKR
jgi:hypothetical protein